VLYTGICSWPSTIFHVHQWHRLPHYFIPCPPLSWRRPNLHQLWATSTELKIWASPLTRSFCGTIKLLSFTGVCFLYLSDFGRFHQGSKKSHFLIYFPWEVGFCGIFWYFLVFPTEKKNMKIINASASNALHSLNLNSCSRLEQKLSQILKI
jgi:hypothetical protein